jgi:hypothetical protein
MAREKFSSAQALAGPEHSEVFTSIHKGTVGDIRLERMTPSV